jgi:hypothetical protein
VGTTSGRLGRHGAALHERDGADHGGEQEHAHELEGEHELAEEDLGDALGAAALERLRDDLGVGRLARVEQRGDGDGHGRDHADPVGGGTERAAGAHRLLLEVEQHDHEQEEHHDGARVHDDLDGREEVGLERDEDDGEREQRADERQGCVHRLAQQHHAERADHHHDREHDEGDHQ